MTRIIFSLLTATAMTLSLSSTSGTFAQSSLGDPQIKTTEVAPGVTLTEKSWSTGWTSSGGKMQHTVQNTVSAQKTPSSASPTVTWCQNAMRQPFPQKPAAGQINGRPVRIDHAELEGGRWLTLIHGADERFPEARIKIGFYSKVGANQAITVTDKTPMGPRLWVDYKDNPAERFTSKTDMYDNSSDKYGMRIQFGQAQNGLLPGYIVLRLPDAQHSFVEGYFYAKLK